MIKSLYPPFRCWSEKGTIWIYSDTHFADTDLPLAFGRPADSDHIKKLNSFVGKNDTLILLGDVGDPAVAAKLKGYKVLLTGNHDKGITNYETVFDEVYGGPLFISDKLLLSHEPIDYPFAVNIHGHDHNNSGRDEQHINVCSDVCGYEPLNLNKFIKNGGLSVVQSIHRRTIDMALELKKNKKIME